MTKERLNSLQLIDVIVVALSRGGPGRGPVLRLSPDVRTRINGYEHLLGLEAGLGSNDTMSLGPTGESFFNAAFLARAYIEVLADSVPKFLTFPMEDQMILFSSFRSWPVGQFVKYAKYVTAWPMAKFLNNDLPAVPEGFKGSPLFGGKVKRLLKSRIASKSDRNARLFFGILQGVKRGAAPVGPDFIQASMEKHRASLTAEPAGVCPVSSLEPHEPFYELIFEGFRYPAEHLFEASTAASFQTKRSEGGAREFLRNERPEGLIKMYESRPGSVETVRGKIAPDFEELLDLARKGSDHVMVSAVLEPLKVRLITKGDSHRYWLSRYYQKGLWQHLQGFPQFVLTARPLEPGDLSDILKETADLGLGDEFDEWVSGDYSAATDSLDIRHTKAAFEASLRAVGKEGTEVSDVLRSVLYEQTLNYPNKTGLPATGQVTGQLMGSTLSFPILCIVNLVAYWRALNKYRYLYKGTDGTARKTEMKMLPVRINGDDILFRSNKKFYQLWLEEIGQVGFQLSLGKNYVHGTYLTVNSQLYSHRGGNLTRLGWLNTGLLTGQSKVTGRNNAKIAPLWDYYNKIVEDAVDPLRAHRRFLHYHKVAINELTQRGQYNLFLPFERGGLGFIPPLGHRYTVTSFQRRFATFLFRKFTSDPGMLNTIALVSEKNSSKLVLYHQPRLIIGPKIGPLAKNLVIPTTREVQLPPLALPGESTDSPELRVRLPRPRTIREFRRGTYRRMGGDVHSFPWRPIEHLYLSSGSEEPAEDWHSLSEVPLTGDSA